MAPSSVPAAISPGAATCAVKRAPATSPPSILLTCETLTLLGIGVTVAIASIIWEMLAAERAARPANAVLLVFAVLSLLAQLVLAAAVVVARRTTGGKAFVRLWRCTFAIAFAMQAAAAFGQGVALRNACFPSDDSPPPPPPPNSPPPLPHLPSHWFTYDPYSYPGFAGEEEVVRCSEGQFVVFLLGPLFAVPAVMYAIAALLGDPRDYIDAENLRVTARGATRHTDATHVQHRARCARVPCGAGSALGHTCPLGHTPPISP